MGTTDRIRKHHPQPGCPIAKQINARKMKIHTEFASRPPTDSYRSRSGLERDFLSLSFVFRSDLLMFIFFHASRRERLRLNRLLAPVDENAAELFRKAIHLSKRLEKGERSIGGDLRSHSWLREIGDDRCDHADRGETGQQPNEPETVPRRPLRTPQSLVSRVKERERAAGGGFAASDSPRSQRFCKSLKHVPNDYHGDSHHFRQNEHNVRPSWISKKGKSR